MTRFAHLHPTKLFVAIGALAAALVAGTAAAAAPGVDEAQLLSLGFKVLVATNKVQEDWVRTLPPGKIRAMQRTGKKFYVYPDASANRVFVGGPAEFDAYRKLHPEEQQAAQDAAAKSSAYRAKQDATMRAATARDLSDPFLGASWADLGW
jgi:hypothetical protein